MKRLLFLCIVCFASFFGFTQTTKTIFSPKNPNGIAVICCPGGGYEVICNEHEGKGWAKELNEMGITWIVIDYQLPNGNPELPFSSILETMKDIKAHAKEYNIDTTKIGIAGFSAGGHLAATYSRYAPENEKPAFQILFYPVISMDEKLTHSGSRAHLLGENPSSKLVKTYSLEKQADKSVPPTLIFVSMDDSVVPLDNSIEYYSSLRKVDVPANLQIFPIGNHGWGNNPEFTYHQAIINELYLFFTEGLQSNEIFEYQPISEEK